MATLSQKAFIAKLKEAANDNVEWADFCEWVRERLPERWNEDGSPADSSKGDNASLTNYIRIKRDNVVRNMGKRVLDGGATPEEAKAAESRIRERLTLANEPSGSSGRTKGDNGLSLLDDFLDEE